MGGIEGRRAIVTGGAGSIGRAITEALAAAGAHVTTCDIRDDVLSVAGRLRAEGQPVDVVVADVSSPTDVRRLVDASGPVDVPVDHADAPSCPWRQQPRRPGGGASFDLYDAAKWGLNGLAHAWAAALRSHGVRVNNVCVGATDTEMLRSFLREAPDPALVATWMRPAQVAALLLDLLREGPSGRSGDNIGVWVGPPLALPPPGATSLS